MDENKKPSEGVQPDAADVESLRDKEVGSGPQAEIAKPEDKVPEAAGSLGDIADRLNAISIQQQSDSQKSEAFQRKSLYVQWCLFGATAAAFFAAAYYSGISKQQKGTMERQVEATKEALVSVQRAFIRWNGLSIWSACPSQQRNCVDEYCDDYAEIAARVPQKK